MPPLHNRVSNEELKRRLYEEKDPRTTISFYQYFPIEDPVSFRNDFYLRLSELHVFGRIYIAKEGINAQISVPTPLFEALKNYLHSINGLENLRLNIAVDDDGKSFWVLRVKVRDKIVADGIDDPLFDMRNKGQYVDAKTFNDLANDPNTLLLDMRNHYEYEVGHFDGAIEVPSDTFRDQLPMAVDMLKEQKDKTVIMYCTGGIRCEKASAYMLHAGFKNVFHLEGGIIHYANQVKENGLENKFKGKNFVFDQRMGERISNDIIAHCHQCGRPCDTHVNCAYDGCHLLFIQCEQCAEKFENCCSSECQSIRKLPKDQQVLLRQGKEKYQSKHFSKSRAGLKNK
jgi:UPF0176 protein